MLILQKTKADAICQLQRFSSTLNGGRVKQKKVFDKISEIYQVLCQRSTDDIRYIEAAEQETDTVLREYLTYICSQNNLAACVYLGKYCSVYARQNIEKALKKNMVAVYTFPTVFETNKIIIYTFVLSQSYSELYDVDYAMNMLQYYD